MMLDVGHVGVEGIHAFQRPPWFSAVLVGVPCGVRLIFLGLSSIPQCWVRQVGDSVALVENKFEGGTT